MPEIIIRLIRATKGTDQLLWRCTCHEVVRDPEEHVRRKHGGVGLITTRVTVQEAGHRAED